MSRFPPNWPTGPRARQHLLEALSMYSDELMELLLAEEEPPAELDPQRDTVGRGQLEFTPVLIGSAYRNKGVQPLLDAVVRYCLRRWIADEGLRTRTARAAEEMPLGPTRTSPPWRWPSRWSRTPTAR